MNYHHEVHPDADRWVKGQATDVPGFYGSTKHFSYQKLLWAAVTIAALIVAFCREG